jgi:hypothetical protein
MLKVLILRNHHSITGRSLEFLGWIEGLEVVELTGCRLAGTGFQSLKQNGWVRDDKLAEELEKECGVVGVMKDCQGDEERQKLVLQIGDTAPRGSRLGLVDSYVFRRDRKTISAKRKEKGDGKGICLPTKKPRMVRDSRMKDMGDLLVEFGSRVKNDRSPRK